MDHNLFDGQTGEGSRLVKRAGLGKSKSQRGEHFRRCLQHAGRGRGALDVQGYLAHKKLPPPRTLQWADAYGPRAVLGGGQFLMSEVPLYGDGLAFLPH